MNRAVPFSSTAAGVLFTTEFGPMDRMISVQIVSAGTATITFEASNDGGTTWVATTGNGVGSAGAATTTSTTAGIFVFPAQTRAFRARVSAYTSGTVSGVAVTGGGWNK